MNPTVLVAGILIVALLAVMASIDVALLRDLAATPDHELSMLTRAGWVAAIIFTFPIGPILYVRYGKLR